MIKGERKKDGYMVECKCGSEKEIFYELIETTSSLFAEIVRDDITDAEISEFFAKYAEALKAETMSKKERLRKNDPNFIVREKSRMKMPWE